MTVRPRTITEVRAADRERKQEARREAKALWIPKPRNIRRRRRRECDVFKWLRWYLPGVFTEPFQRHHVEMVESILSATTYAGDQAIAAPRGEGKTTIAECVMLYCILKGTVTFSVLFAATAGDARNSLASIRQYLSESDRLLADYPEVCVPVREVTGTPQLAHSLVIRTKKEKFVEAGFQWSGDEITMPRVPGSKCAGAIIATRGLDSAVRGLKRGSARPQLALIDDPDTEDTARSEEQAKKLEARIDRAIAGLAPRGKRMSRVMLTTLQNRTCVSARFTDRKIKPSWQGKRFAFLLHAPNREDLWDEYVLTRQSSMSEGDPFARKAHKLYLSHRKAMDAGAVVANPHSFDGRTLADGSQLQVSAVQRYYDFVADNGIESAMSELQNDPPEEAGPVESGITANTILFKLNGYPRRIIPPGCTVLTQGIDVRKVALHWVVRAWRPDGTGFTIDHGVQDVGKPRGTGGDEGVDLVLIRALWSRREDMAAEPYITADGEIRDIDLTLVDAGWQTNAIYHACKELGSLDWKPAMGFGRSMGCVKVNFNAPARSTTDRKPGDGWFLSRQPRGTWLVCCDTDRWKQWEHNRWLTPENHPGSMSIYGEPVPRGHRLTQDQKDIFSYAHHLVAEVEAEEPIKGVLQRRWRAKSNNNHWYDASYLSDVAAAMKGITVLRVSGSANQAERRAAIKAAGGWMAVQGKGR